MRRVELAFADERVDECAEPYVPAELRGEVEPRTHAASRVQAEPTVSAVLADSYFLRLRGLIGRDVNELGGLLLHPCNQVHTCFMGGPIDIVYLDAAGTVLKVDEAVEPSKFCKAVRGAREVLELPAGRAVELGLRPRIRLWRLS